MFEKKNLIKELDQIEKKLQQQENWGNFEKVNEDLKKKNYLSNFLDSINKFDSNFNDVMELINVSDESENQDLLNDLENELNNIKLQLNSLYIETLMSGKADSKNALVEIHSGAGGVESQDWVAMLLRMYTKWAESKKFKINLIDQSVGDEAGFKSITIKINGERSYGWLKLESGVHRLVRISPFDSQSRRHTSFASVFCYPEIDNSVNDTYRASGAGGQHVNKTDSAVRLTHIPTKITVQCQSSRSQHRNKSIAMEMLKSKLYEIEIAKEEEVNKKNRSEKGDISWGNQIRSYVMQPYTMVKDHRTNKEFSDINAVLNGKIDVFLETQLFKLN